MSTLSHSRLSISNLSANAPGSHQRVLKDISCSISNGEVMAVVGPNGVGKSTLLHCLTGDVDIVGGDIQIADIPRNPQARARHLAMLPQFSLLNFPYRVDEVVQLGRIPHKTSRQTNRDIINEVLDAMDISCLAQRLYTELSGGEKQRVQIARVLAQIWRAKDARHGQRILLLDEPTTALDLGHQHQLMRTIQSFASSGVMIIIVLHDLNLAARYADKILALLDNQMLAFGDPDEVFQQATVEALFATRIAVLDHPDYSTPIVLGQ